MSDSEKNDLDWLAFRYVAAEMTRAEAESFETLLADEQSAREAVAVAVELTQAVAYVVPVPAAASRASVSVRSYYAAFLAVAAAVAAGLLFAFSTPMRTQQLAQRDVTADLEETGGIVPRELVEAWTEAELAYDDDSTVEALVELAQNDVVVDLASVGRTELDVPDWLVAAVAVELGQESDTSTATPLEK
ncbi:MAG: hypothetical protein CMJ48_03710 [Planctomycetaceae bacterium]|nr:hypothetical protein [Planctomycetaceae bacterium]